jgi:nitroreductase
MFNDLSSLRSFLATRRSCKPRDLIEPGPSADELLQIVALASRIPDHGKLHPWCFVHIPRSARAEFAALLQRAYLKDRPSPGRLEIEANETFAHQAPELIVVLSAPRESKIPAWEQELSCGAALACSSRKARRRGCANPNGAIFWTTNGQPSSNRSSGWASMWKNWSTGRSPDGKTLRAGKTSHLVAFSFAASISASLATCAIPVFPTSTAHSSLPSHTAFHAGWS